MTHPASHDTPRMTYTAAVEDLENGAVRRYVLLRGGRPLARGDVLALWRGDAGFVSYFTGLLAQAPFEAYFWETPPLTCGALARPFEFVVVDSPELARVAEDPHAFSKYFSGSGVEEIAAFTNLGGDARLIAPLPGARGEGYPHLAAFSRKAPPDTQRALWQRTADEAGARLGEQPLWISTSGLGVYWLHVRLDSRPKYYTWKPYALTGSSS